MAEISITIPNNKVTEFKIGFLKAYPVPLDEDEKPIMLENQWIQQWLKDRLIGGYQKGKLQIHEENISVDMNILKG